MKDVFKILVKWGISMSSIVKPKSRFDRLRIGAFKWANSLPLVALLDEIDLSQIEITYASPKELSLLMAQKRLDVALLPVVALLQNPNYRICPAGCISSAGAVKSVGIYHSVPLENASRVALDIKSSTSVALAKLVLKKQYDKAYTFVEWNSEAGVIPDGEDAFLVIGENCLRLKHNSLRFLDLGEAWWCINRLPMVYAVWTMRQGTCDYDRVLSLLTETKNRGRAVIDSLSIEASSRTGMSVEEAKVYLSKNILFDFTKDSAEGLAKFASDIQSSGLLQVANFQCESDLEL